LYENSFEWLTNIEARHPMLDEFTAIMLMSHDYKTDLRNLKMAMKTNVSYIGLLGPKKCAMKMFDDLEREGISISENDHARIFAPTGLDIGANTPEEISLSILAEIISNFTGRKGSSLRLREKTIHQN
jgi:xanthine/CO dehydrogenase XdhC/CoxF family maturation factor